MGGDGWRCGHWLNIYRDIHHGLLEIPCGEGEVREIELRADWEWGELIYHDYWVKVRPIIELGNHERVDERIDGSSYRLIWGGASVLT